MPKAVRKPFIKFYPDDWANDSVATCSLTAQGLWLRMMILAHHGSPYGHLAHLGGPIPSETIAAKCGCSPREYASLLDELLRAGVPGVTKKGVLFSRRMVRDHHAFMLGRKYGPKGGNPKLLDEESTKGLTPRVNPASNSASEIGVSGSGGAGGEGGNGRPLSMLEIKALGAAANARARKKGR